MKEFDLQCLSHHGLKNKLETFTAGVLMIFESKQGNQFLDPMTSFSRLIVSEPAILYALSKLNPLKATGPHGIPSWILKE